MRGDWSLTALSDFARSSETPEATSDKPALTALTALEWVFMGLVYEMAVPDVDYTISARSQVLVMGYYHQSFLFLTD